MYNSQRERQCNHRRHGRGPSSFWMHDPKKIFAKLKLKPGDHFLDLGCGPGDYSIQASKIVGGAGQVYSLDKTNEAIDLIQEKIKKEACKNVHAIKADIIYPLPIGDSCIDICLMSTVLHIFQIRQAELNLFREIRRVLKAGGRLAVIECKKEEQSFGPPIHMRLSPDEVWDAVKDHGFKKIDLTDLGYNYLIQFSAE